MSELLQAEADDFKEKALAEKRKMDRLAKKEVQQQKSIAAFVSCK